MCDALQPQARDLETIKARVKSEGLSFLTITLPSLGQDLERALDQGFIGPAHFRGFRKRGKIPAFLQGFFGQIFDVWSGRLYESPRPSVRAIAGIRQLAYVYKKLNCPCSLERERKAVTEFKQAELDLSEPLPNERQNYFNLVSDLLWPSVIRAINPFDTVPRHGPGATAERIRSNRKYIVKRWHDRLEGYFPLLSNAFHNETAYDSEDFKNVSAVDETQEQPVRVVLVPKTLKTPRVIAIEPVCMQYTQQAISAALVKAIEHAELTAGHINFTDQSINQRLALTSSMDKRFATLDLSSASDRVPRSLALCMFSSNPELQGAVDACRSRSAKLPTGEVIPLLKFASMGSALCFPVESMYFYTLCIGALLRKYGLPVTFLNIRKVSRSVFIYGDDIIVPTDDASFVVDHLQEYYCKVNSSKSFWSGSFRESCGVEAYRGVPVTPVYIRELPPNNKRDVSQLLSYVSASNQLYKGCYWRVSQLLKSFVETVLGKLPIVGENSEALGWQSFQAGYSSYDRWNKRLHRPEVRAWVTRPIYQKDSIDGLPALIKCLLKLERSSDVLDQTGGQQHLIKTARYGAVTLKRRWTVPY
jgi:hypothetical protein